MPAGYDLSGFQAFVCYHEKSPHNAKGFAEIIHYALEIAGVKSFVAHMERNNYSEVFDDVRDEILKRHTKYFIFINTQGSLIRTEIMKEFNMAYPSGLGSGPKFLVFRHDSAEMTNAQFENNTGIKLGHNQPTFENESKLVEIMRNVIKKYNIAAQIPSNEELQRDLNNNRLTNYLKYCASLMERKNNLDNKTLSELYVPNDSILVEGKTWNQPDNELLDYSEWRLSDFLKGEKRLEYVAASYGIGKTSWTFNIAAELARKNLNTMFSEGDSDRCYTVMR